MSPFVLSVLKYSLLVLLYFFVYRVVRSVASDVVGRRAAGSPPRQAASPRPARGGRPPASVVVHGSDGKKLGTFRLSGPMDIGRADGCAIKLDDAYASQIHARLYPRDGTWLLEDLGSTNGTFLNDRRVGTPEQVKAGDVVRIGKTVLELRR